MSNDDVLRNLAKLQQGMAEIGDRPLPLRELLTDGFVQRQTEFQDAHAFLTAAGRFPIPDDAGDEWFDTEEFGEFLRTKTRFESLNQLRLHAIADLARTKLGFQRG